MCNRVIKEIHMCVIMSESTRNTVYYALNDDER